MYGTPAWSVNSFCLCHQVTNCQRGPGQKLCGVAQDLMSFFFSLHLERCANTDSSLSIYTHMRTFAPRCTQKSGQVEASEAPRRSGNVGSLLKKKKKEGGQSTPGPGSTQPSASLEFPLEVTFPLSPRVTSWKWRPLFWDCLLRLLGIPLLWWGRNARHQKVAKHKKNPFIRGLVVPAVAWLLLLLPQFGLILLSRVKCPKFSTYQMWFS